MASLDNEWYQTVRIKSFRLRFGRRSLLPFLMDLNQGAEVLDIGCGNDSPFTFKTVRPDIRYVGLDVGDYNQRYEPTKYADEYLIVPPDEFSSAIAKRSGQFDAVVSKHNLEHCFDPDAVLVAMAGALRPGGRIFLAFPSASSVRLPSRQGTLNFHDDETHLKPPDFSRVLQELGSSNIAVDFSAERYRPPVAVARGILNEPRSRILGRVFQGTWALYGFETVIWGTKMR